MKQFLLILCLLCSTATFAKGKGAKPKILIHEIGVKHIDSWVFSSEANQYQDATYLNPSITFSSKYNIDITLASQNIPVWKNGAQNYQDDTYLMVSKTFRIDEDNDFIIGSQNGYALYAEDGKPITPGKMHQFYYITHVTQVNDWLKLHGGSYYVNSALSTTTNYFGAIGGFEAKWDNFVVRGDYLSAHTNISGATVTAGYFIEDSINPYVGIGVPETNSGNEFYGIVGITFSTESLK